MLVFSARTIPDSILIYLTPIEERMKNLIFNGLTTFTSEVVGRKRNGKANPCDVNRMTNCYHFFFKYLKYKILEGKYNNEETQNILNSLLKLYFPKILREAQSNREKALIYTEMALLTNKKVYLDSAIVLGDFNNWETEKLFGQFYFNFDKKLAENAFTNALCILDSINHKRDQIYYDILYKKALSILYQEDRLKDAKVLFKKCVEKMPLQRAVVLTNYGMCHLKMDEPDYVNAKKSFDKAMSIDSTLYQAKLGFVRAFIEHNKLAIKDTLLTEQEENKLIIIPLHNLLNEVKNDYIGETLWYLGFFYELKNNLITAKKYYIKANEEGFNGNNLKSDNEIFLNKIMECKKW